MSLSLIARSCVAFEIAERGLLIVQVARGSVIQSFSVGQGGRDSFRLVAFAYSLDKGREPLDEGKRLAAVSIGDEAAEWVHGTLVETEVDPGAKPTELAAEPRGLEAQDTEYV